MVVIGHSSNMVDPTGLGQESSPAGSAPDPASLAFARSGFLVLYGMPQKIKKHDRKSCFLIFVAAMGRSWNYYFKRKRIILTTVSEPTLSP